MPRMKRIWLLALGGWIAGPLLTAQAWALVLEAEAGDVSGLNDGVLEAEDLGALAPGDALRAEGFVSALDANDVDFYRFEVTGAPLVPVHLDVDYAAPAGSGLDAMLWVFDASGTLIAASDDGLLDPGSEPGGIDPFIGALELVPGTYHAAVSSWANEPIALLGDLEDGVPLSVSGYLQTNVVPGVTAFDNGGVFTGFYYLQIRTSADDAVQCGDVNDDGPVDGADWLGLRFYLAAPDRFPLPAQGLARCGVIGGPRPCNLQDVAVLLRALVVPSLPPGIQEVCAS